LTANEIQIERPNRELNACRQTLSAAIAALADQVEILDQAAKRHPRDD
jgi:hypothetical protein